MPEPRQALAPTVPQSLSGREPTSQAQGAVPLASEPLAIIEPAQRPLDQAALDGLRKAISSSSIYEEDYVNLAEVGMMLSRISPDLNARNYGFPKLRDFVRASGIVEVKMKIRKIGSPIALVRLKD